MLPVLLMFLLAPDFSAAQGDKGAYSCDDFVCIDPDATCEINEAGMPVCVPKCQSCPADMKDPVCGADGRTYSSFCVLKEMECMSEVEIGFACNGECPCDPVEVEKMDPETVRKLHDLRQSIQLEADINAELVKSTKDSVTFEILNDGEDELVVASTPGDLRTTVITRVVQTTQKPRGSDDCPAEEMGELPERMLDWFHVLKTNEKKRTLEQKGLSQKSVLREMKFFQAKLKSQYSRLACNMDRSEELCSDPVKWMFDYLDSNKDGRLSSSELYEIEGVRSEHCIKPFLRSCDVDSDGAVQVKELCHCLCIEPPCTKIMNKVPSILVAGVPRPLPNVFAPKCDEDGFFMPTQCHKGQCWCVDRNGAEYAGTRSSANVPSCEDNTVYRDDNPKMIPLDLSRESKREA